MLLLGHWGGSGDFGMALRREISVVKLVFRVPNYSEEWIEAGGQ